MDRRLSQTYVSPRRVVYALQEEPQPKCKTSKNHHGVSRWSIKPYSSALKTLYSSNIKMPCSYGITIGCSYDITTPCSYDIRIGCSSDITIGCSYDIKTSIIDELRVMSRYEQLWAIAIFICCTFAVLKMKNETPAGSTPEDWPLYHWGPVGI